MYKLYALVLYTSIVEAVVKAETVEMTESTKMGLYERILGFKQVGCTTKSRCGTDQGSALRHSFLFATFKL